MQDKLADQIRNFAYQRYIKPARDAGQSQVTIRAGDVHTNMGLSSRMPAVCGALGTKLFEYECRIKRIRTDGPSQGASTTYTFAV
jgi:5-methylcytosine-specific restriction protein B